VIYLDTSAFLKLHIREDGSELVQAKVMSQADPLPLWDLQQAELVNALRLKVYWGDITPQESDRLIDLFDDRLERGQYFVPETDRSALMAKFRSLSDQTPRTGCRTLDILHVACALLLPVDLFVSFEERQRRLATRVGLNVAPET
jgi:predicted nucleic acid-binding protein